MSGTYDEKQNKPGEFAKRVPPAPCPWCKGTGRHPLGGLEAELLNGSEPMPAEPRGLLANPPAEPCTGCELLEAVRAFLPGAYHRDGCAVTRSHGYGRCTCGLSALEDVVYGRVPCPTCGGKGEEPLPDHCCRPCPTCNGSGSVLPGGLCPRCTGRGKVPSREGPQTCPACNGARRLPGEPQPFTCRTEPAVVAALRRLETAAANREHTMGDPPRLLEVQAELRAAAAHAREVLPPLPTVKADPSLPPGTLELRNADGSTAARLTNAEPGQPKPRGGEAVCAACGARLCCPTCAHKARAGEPLPAEAHLCADCLGLAVLPDLMDALANAPAGEPCPECDGTGRNVAARLVDSVFGKPKDDMPSEHCTACGGTGRITGLAGEPVTCARCNGFGRLPADERSNTTEPPEGREGNAASPADDAQGEHE